MAVQHTTRGYGGRSLAHAKQPECAGTERRTSAAALILCLVGGAAACAEQGGDGGPQQPGLSRAELRKPPAGSQPKAPSSSGSARGRCGSGYRVIEGTPGDDRLVGSDEPDCILGLSGNDEILGGDGADLIFGGPGHDSIHGGEGADRIEGGPGDDVILGGDDEDRISGGDGHDLVSGGEDRDRVDLGPGNDVAVLDEDDDEETDERDIVDGGAGKDACRGNSCELPAPRQGQCGTVDGDLGSYGDTDEGPRPRMRGPGSSKGKRGAAAGAGREAGKTDRNNDTDEGADERPRTCPTGKRCELGLGICVACRHDAECNDAGNVCTHDVCAPTEGCSNPPVTDGTLCLDQTVCNGTETCRAGLCTPGTPLDCDDRNVCTDDSCDAATGCVHVDNASPCDDANLCTQVDTCRSGTCVGSDPVVCIALDQCHEIGICDPGTGICSNPAKPDGTTCIDGDACTRTDVCRAGVCVGINPVVCVAQDQCHVAGTCDSANGVCSNPAKADGAVCDDGSLCTRKDTCVAGACSGDDPVVCPEETCRELWTCAPASGECFASTKPDAALCVDRMVIGRVLSDHTGFALAGASVRSVETSTTTRADGRYNLATDQSNLTVVAQLAGFTSVARAVAIQPDVGSVAVDARLTPLANPVEVGPGGATLNARLSRWTSAAAEATLTVPPGAFPGPTSLRLTPLSAQGLPARLPLGWSPLAALDLRAGDAAPLQANLTLDIDGLPEGPVLFVRYEPDNVSWRVMSAPNLAAGGTLHLELSQLGSYAVVSSDDGGPVHPAVGDPLTGVDPAGALPIVAAFGQGTPGLLPAGGGLVEGRVLVAASAPLPSGTVVQVATSETYDLATGTVASSPTQVQDIALYRSPVIDVANADTTGAVVVLGARFPIQASRTYAASALRKGNIHIDVLAGREEYCGAIGGLDALSTGDGDALLQVASHSLAEQTVLDIEQQRNVADYLPHTDGIVPLSELCLDLSGEKLRKPASLSLGSLASAGGTLLLARIERVDGVAYPIVVAVGKAQPGQSLFSASSELPGIRQEGTYVVYGAAEPVGFVAGTTRTEQGTPVSTLVTTRPMNPSPSCCNTSARRISGAGSAICSWS